MYDDVGFDGDVIGECEEVDFMLGCRILLGGFRIFTVVGVLVQVFEVVQLSRRWKK